MLDLPKLEKECFAILEKLNIEVPEQKIQIRVSAENYPVGKCEMMNNGDFRISIGKYLIQHDILHGYAVQVLLHELIHTATVCGGHGKSFAKYQRMIRKSIGININCFPSTPDKKTGYSKKYLVAHCPFCKWTEVVYNKKDIRCFGRKIAPFSMITIGGCDVCPQCGKRILVNFSK